MQPSNSLIALGISAVLAASAIGVSPAVAEPGARHRQSPAANREATQAGLPTAETALSETVEAAETPTPGESDQSRVDRSSARSGSRSQSSAQSAIQSTQTSSAPTAIGQQPSDPQRRIENRLDQLQTESQIREQLNQSQFRSSDRPLAPRPDALRLDQDIQQQLNMQDLQNLRQPVQISPSRSLDRLQFEQRVRQQLRQPNSVPERQTQASRSSASTDTPTHSNASETSYRQILRSVHSAHAEATADQPKVQAQAEEGTAPTQIETRSTASEAQISSPGTEPAETSSAQEQPAQKSEPGSVQTPSKPEAELSSPAPHAASGSQPAPEAVPARVNSEAQSQNQPTSSTEAAPTPGATRNSGERNRSNNRSNNRSSNRANNDLLNSGDNPAPEYLNPDPNPLSFPTRTEEVQIVGTQPLTLKQAVDLAIRNNPDLEQDRLTLERTQADLSNTESSNYPTLDATANFTQAGTESAAQQPDTLGVNPTTGQSVPNPNAGDITRTYRDSTTLGTGLQLSYSIYTSGRRPALIRAAQGQVRLQQLEVERKTEQLILDTTTDYYDLQQAGAQVNIFRANLTQAEQSLRDAQALERAGVGTRFDVLQSEVDVANARQNLTQQVSRLEIARRQLSQRLNIAQSIDLAAADPIEVAGVWDLSLEETIVQAYKNRAELEQSLIQREIAQQNRRAALAQLGPQLSLNSQFNLTNDVDTDFAFVYNYQAAVSASLILFDGGASRSQANREESNVAIAESQFEQARDQIRFQVEQAYSQLDANFANIQTTALAVEQAAESLRLARLRFQAGVGTQLDVLNQQSALAQAQVNNLSAILDYNRALATLQRSISNYPEGYLNDSP